MPWLDYVWINNPIKRFLRGKGVSPGAAFAMARVQERREELAKGKGKDWNDTSRDFLSRFLEIEEKESVPPYAVAAWASSNITAGSDTTGIYLRTVFYELLTHSESRNKLIRELDTAASQSCLSPLATWGETSKLPYLDACIKEAGRLHPPFALPYERVVPTGGATLCGARVEEGTVVGMSAWVVHRDEELFGDDCDRWRPERWLEVSPERKREMENGLLMVRHPSNAGEVDDADVFSSLALVRECVWGSTLRTWRCIRLLLRFCGDSRYVPNIFLSLSRKLFYVVCVKADDDGLV